VAKHFAQLKAKNIFPLLPSTAYVMYRSQSVSLSKLDADVYTREKGAKKSSVRDWREGAGRYAEINFIQNDGDVPQLYGYQTKTAMFSRTWYPERRQRTTRCGRILLI